jgi:hypothetical protein
MATLGLAAMALPGTASADASDVCARYPPDDMSVWKW